MKRVCVWLLEALLPPDVADSIIGDLIEQGPRRGNLWLLEETIAALWLLRRPRRKGGEGMVRFANDLRIAARVLRRSPGFAAACILTLGLAIGATTAILSVVEPVLFRPLPYLAPERLAIVWERERDGSRDNVGFATARDYAANARSIERWAAVSFWQPTLTDKGEPERVNGERVSWSYFRTLGVRPFLGRDFLAEEDVPGRNQVVILSYGLWQRRYGADTTIVGHAIAIDGNSMTVAGVMPASFDNVIAPDATIWRALGYANQPWTCRSCRHLRMVVRLRDDVDVADANRELDQIHARLVRAYPTEYASTGTWVVPLQFEATREFRPGLTALTLAVLLLLAIAISNVVNLQLARAVRREADFAVRMALGAGQLRLMGQLLAEGLLLSALGGIVGLAVARLTIPLLVARLPEALPRAHAIHLDVAALGIVTVVIALVSLALAIVPARRRPGDLGFALRSRGRISFGGRRATRAGLVVGEVALAVMLLVAAGLIAKSLLRLLSVDVGFEPTHLLSMEINATGPRYPDNATVYANHHRMLDEIGRIPGVDAVAIANQIPLGGNLDMYGLWDADNPPANPELAPSADRYVVTPSYFRAMRIPILRGRSFTDADAADTAVKVAVVSAALAQKLWPGQDALGRRIKIGSSSDPPHTIIGVAGNVRHRSLDANVMQQWYIPERQWRQGADNQAVLVVRALGDPAALAPGVRRVAASVDPTQPIVHVATMEQLIAASTAERRLALVLFAAFAGAALLLAVTGIYGVLAGSVAERTREIGVRSALGATPSQIVALILEQGAKLAVFGVILGLSGALVLTRYVRALLFGIAPSDPMTLASVVMLILVASIASCLIPALRATRVDPMRALRSD